MEIAELRAFEQEIARHVPGFQVRFKNESKVQQTLGFLMRPFNPYYLDTFITTLGKTVWFPSFAYYAKDPEASFVVLAHEYVHLHDSRRAPGWFQLSYLFPQILVLLPLVAYAWLAWPWSWLVLAPLVAYVAACAVVRRSMLGFVVIVAAALGATIVASALLAGWATLALVGAFFFLGPWPAPFRVKWEKRGYAMSIAARMWLSGRPPAPASLAYFEKQFTGFNYFRMAWRAAPIKTALVSVVERVSDGELQGEKPYSHVRDFLCQHSLLRQA